MSDAIDEAEAFISVTSHVLITNMVEPHLSDARFN